MGFLDNITAIKCQEHWMQHWSAATAMVTIKWVKAKEKKEKNKGVKLSTEK